MKPESFLDHGENSKVPRRASQVSSKDKDPKSKNRADC